MNWPHRHHVTEATVNKKVLNVNELKNISKYISLIIESKILILSNFLFKLMAGQKTELYFSMILHGSMILDLGHLLPVTVLISVIVCMTPE